MPMCISISETGERIMADMYAFLTGDELSPAEDRRREGVWERKIMPTSSAEAPYSVCP